MLASDGEGSAIGLLSFLRKHSLQHEHPLQQQNAENLDSAGTRGSHLQDRAAVAAAAAAAAATELDPSLVVCASLDSLPGQLLDGSQAASRRDPLATSSQPFRYGTTAGGLVRVTQISVL